MLGGVWLAGRVWYALAYARDPKTRGRGFLLSMLAFGALGLGGAWGVLRGLLAEAGGCRRAGGGTGSGRDGGSPQLRAGAARRLRPLRALLPYVARYRGQVALALLFLLLAAGATLALPFAVKLLVDGGAVPPGSGAWRAPGGDPRHFLGLFGVAVVLGLATAARFYMVSWIGERVTTDLRQAVYAHVLRQSPQFFENLKTGEVLSRLTTDTTVIHTPSAPASAWACATSSCSPAG
jgi:hypothetical protein